MQKTVFVVDDNDTNLTSAKEALKNQYRVMTLPSAIKMFAFLEKMMPDLILLDIEMPDQNGFEALEQLKNDPRYADIPVVFLTSMVNKDVEVRGFELGVVDFITKPFSEPVLQNRIKTHLEIDELIRERTKQLQLKTEQLEDKTRQLERLQNGLVFALADMIEKRDLETGGHVERTSEYIRILTEAMISCGLYAEELRGMNVKTLMSSARLHDIGKITISDTILNKPGKLTDKEFEIMKSHTTAGEKAIDQLIERTGDADLLSHAKLFAGYHHERWDGKGYPYGKRGEGIPLQGRIMAIVDVYDALVSERPYKKPFTHEEAVKIIMENTGTQFDPFIADVFYNARDKFMEISEQSGEMPR